MTDELRERLAGLDPVPATVPVDPVTSDRARALLEAVMSSPVLPDAAPAGDAGAPGAAEPTSSAGRRPGSARRWYVGLGAAAAVVVAVGVGAVLAARAGDDAPATAGPPVTLTLSATDPALSICAPFDPALLGSADVAFAGTVTTVSPGSVVLDVDRWFRGGAGEQATITVPEGFMAALDGTDFVGGQRYLVTSQGGTVLGCGSSGPATPELEQVFAEVFGA